LTSIVPAGVAVTDLDMSTSDLGLRHGRR
jgi:hypothetical protein